MSRKKKEKDELRGERRADMDQPKKKRGGVKGCLTVIVIFFGFCFGMGFLIAAGIIQAPATGSKVAQYIDVSDEEAAAIEQVLSDCGIEDISAIERDELLNNAHVDGETGYRLDSGNIKNIVLYLLSDGTVNQIRYVDHDLYADGAVVATLQDYTVSKDELDKYQYLCKEKVKGVLKSPSTAKFPNYTEWGFKQEKNIFTVQGYVDAKNEFGAEVRSQFQLVIDMDSDVIQSFVFDGEELIK